MKINPKPRAFDLPQLFGEEEDSIRPENPIEHCSPPLVSVIMPVYNGGPYLSEAIESILSQSFENFELIAVDDASSDGSWEILAAYAEKDDRITLVRNEKNLGHCITSNKAIGMARGKYIARQDQDDISMPERFSAQVNYLERNSEVGLLGTAYYRLHTKGERRLRRPPQTHTAICWRFLFSNVLCHSTVMTRRELYDDGRTGYRDVPGPQDYDLWTRLIRRTRVACLPDTLLVYRVLDVCMTTMYGDRQVRAAAEISAQQIRSLLPDRTLTSVEIECLRSLVSPRRLSDDEIGVLPIMFEIFEAFERQPDMDSDIVGMIRKHWVARVLKAASARQLIHLRDTGLFDVLPRRDSLALFSSAILRLPVKAARIIKQSL